MQEAESLETAAEHERILREIESTDTACIGLHAQVPWAPGPQRGGHGRDLEEAPRDCAPGRLSRASAGPPLRRTRRATPPRQGRSPLQPRRPGVGFLPRPSAPAAPLPCRLLPPPQGLGQPSFSSEAGLLARAAGARRTDGGSRERVPLRTSPFCPRLRSCLSQAKTEFTPRSVARRANSCL